MKCSTVYIFAASFIIGSVASSQDLPDFNGPIVTIKNDNYLEVDNKTPNGIYCLDACSPLYDGYRQKFQLVNLKQEGANIVLNYMTPNQKEPFFANMTISAKDAQNILMTIKPDDQNPNKTCQLDSQDRTKVQMVYLVKNSQQQDHTLHCN